MFRTRSSSPHKRQSLQSSFEGLKISPAMYKTYNLPKLLRDSIRAKLPARAKFTLKMGPNYDFNRFTPDPDDVFKDSVAYLAEIQTQLSTGDGQMDKIYEDDLVESMVMMIFTSNELENAGASHPVTLRLCKEIFAGNPIPEDLGERGEEYGEIVQYLMKKKNTASPEAVLRSRQQIVQHAYALKHITYRMVIKNEPLSEEILKETHKILTDGINAENEEKDKSETYGGIYRKDQVGWTFTAFAPPKDISKRMAATIKEFKEAIQTAEKQQSLDSFEVASCFFHKILNIHPFLDGNSRLCQLLINTVLLKYTGIVIPIGRDSIEADKFKETVTRASVLELDDEETRGNKPPWAEVTTLVAIQGRSSLRVLKDKFLAKQNGLVYQRQKSIKGYHWERDEDGEGEEDEYADYWDEDGEGSGENSGDVK